MKRRTKLALGGAVALLGACVCGVGALVLVPLASIDDPLFGDISEFDREAQPWAAVDIPLPDDSTFSFERRHAHPFLAEYDRRLTVRGTAVDLPMNAGGRTFINVYWSDASDGRGPWVRLVDRGGDHPIDLASPSTRGRVCTRDGRSYYVRREGCGWTSSNGGEWRPIGDAEPVPFALPGRYLGAIDGRVNPLRFRSAAELPEVPIEPL